MRQSVRLFCTILRASVPHKNLFFVISSMNGHILRKINTKAKDYDPGQVRDDCFEFIANYIGTKPCSRPSGYRHRVTKCNYM